MKVGRVGRKTKINQFKQDEIRICEHIKVQDSHALSNYNLRQELEELITVRAWLEVHIRFMFGWHSCSDSIGPRAVVLFWPNRSEWPAGGDELREREREREMGRRREGECASPRREILTVFGSVGVRDRPVGSADVS